MSQAQYSTQTTLLYLFVIGAAVLVAFLSYRKGYACYQNGERQMLAEPEINKWGAGFVFLLLWPLVAFSTCGADYEAYNMLFLNAKDLDFCIGYHKLEPGFAVFNLIIRLFTDNVNIYNGIFAFISIFFIFKALYAMKDIIHFGWGIMAFTCTFFLQYMNIKRIGLAAAIMFFAMQYLIKKQYIKYLIWVLVTALIHTSAVIMVVPLFIMMVFRKKHRYWFVVVCGVAGLALIYAFRNLVIDFAISDRYNNYAVTDAVFGIAQIVYHLPLFFFLLKKRNRSYITFFCLILTVCSFVIGSMGYFIEAIGRAAMYFLFAMAYVPSLNSTYKVLGSDELPQENRLSLFLHTPIADLIDPFISGMIFVLYFVLRIYIYFDGLIISDAVTPYSNIFGQIF